MLALIQNSLWVFVAVADDSSFYSWDVSVFYIPIACHSGTIGHSPSIISAANQVFQGTRMETEF